MTAPEMTTGTEGDDAEANRSSASRTPRSEPATNKASIDGDDDEKFDGFGDDPSVAEIRTLGAREKAAAALAAAAKASSAPRGKGGKRSDVLGGWKPKRGIARQSAERLLQRGQTASDAGAKAKKKKKVTVKEWARETAKREETSDVYDPPASTDPLWVLLNEARIASRMATASSTAADIRGATRDFSVCRDFGRAIAADLLLGFDGRFGIFAGGSTDPSITQIDSDAQRAVVVRVSLIPPESSAARPVFDELHGKKIERTADGFGFGNDDDGVGADGNGGDGANDDETPAEPEPIPSPPPVPLDPEEKLKARMEKHLNKAFSLFGATRRKSKGEASPEPPQPPVVKEPVRAKPFAELASRLVSDLFAQ